jgi:hypothetical protein
MLFILKPVTKPGRRCLKVRRGLSRAFETAQELSKKA